MRKSRVLVLLVVGACLSAAAVLSVAYLLLLFRSLCALERIQSASSFALVSSVPSVESQSASVLSGSSDVKKSGELPRDTAPVMRLCALFDTVLKRYEVDREKWERLQDLAPEGANSWTPDDYAFVESFLGENSVLMDEASATAKACEKFWLLAQPEELRREFFQAHNMLLNALLVACKMDLDRGLPQRGATDFLSAMRLTHALLVFPDNIARGLVSSRHVRLLCWLEVIVPQVSPSDDVLSELVESLEQMLREWPAVKPFLVGHFVSCVRELGDRRVWAQGFGRNTTLRAATYTSLLGGPLRAIELAAFDDLMWRLIWLSEAPYYQVVTTIHQLGESIENCDRDLPVANLLTKSAVRSMVANAKDMTMLGMAILGLKIERFKAKEGKYPASISAVDARTDIGMDFFSGRPLLYRCQEDRYLLYSVGADGVDDGGIEIRNGNGFIVGGDLLWGTHVDDQHGN